MPLQRRSFLKAAASIAPATALRELIAQMPAQPSSLELHPVGAGEDRFGHPHSLGFSSLAFKVTGSETGSNLFIIEHRGLQPGSGPPFHLHYSQEEWFYVMEGEIAFQVGDQRISLKAGESVLAPRRVPHTFSALGGVGRMLIAFCPAGKMEQYFKDAEQNPSLAATEDFTNKYEVKYIGPSPFWKSQG